MNEFIDAHKNYAEGVKNKGLANAQKNVEWFKKHESIISSFLKSQKLVEEPKNSAGSFGNSLRIPLSFTIYLVSIAFVTTWIN